MTTHARMISQTIEKVLAKQDLTTDEMTSIMNTIMEGGATPAQIGGFLTALRMKGETVEEITAGARVMRSKSLKVNIPGPFTIDTCGTGGDKANTFNISTAAALVAAAAGCTVLKHGNRSVSSLCGSADVLESLGVNIDLQPEAVQRCVEKLNIGFMFAPRFHKAMQHVAGTRRELGVRTIFNVLGPLTNPAGAKSQIMGVFSEHLTEVMPMVLRNLGVERAMVVYGMDGLDEITVTDKTKISELKDGKINTKTLDPRDYGIPFSKSNEIKGGSQLENAQLIRKVLSGKEDARRNIVLLNAGAAIYIGNLADSIEKGIEIAAKTINSGLAMEKLNHLIALTGGMKS
jgi:anthranilate phosphoribosyltransferase